VELVECIVTGGAGFIGSHLVESLVREGHGVKVLDNLSRGKLDNLREVRDSIEFVRCDLARQEEAEREVRDADTVFHLAAVIGGVNYMMTHQADSAVNGPLNMNVFDAAVKNGVKHVVFTSSACVYPTYLQTPLHRDFLLKEEMALERGALPESVYGWSKLMAELVLKHYHEDYGLDVTTIRPFNAYGPREFFNVAYGHVIPAMITRTLMKQDPFIVWGSGNQERAFTYVDDLVRGILLGWRKEKTGLPINVGVRERITIRELAEKILKVSGHKAQIELDMSKPEGAFTRAADNTRARELLGWEPKVSLDEGLRRTYEWALENVKV